ncbi:hypothetical protein [Nitrososphaera sp.]|uniref:hypothetical protein n=1 Tax=Nitrososphaera sp. TaxID=1971748 RepID=UPI002EDACA9B
MVKKIPEKSKFEFLDVRLGIRLKYLVPILNFGEFATWLVGAGFKIQQTANVLDNFQGQKGSVDIYLDGNKGVFGVHAASIETAITTTREMIAIISKNYTSIESRIYFYEFDVTANYYYGADVYAKFATLFQDSKDIELINEVLGGGYSQGDIHFMPTGKNIDSSSWYELRIDPKFNSLGDMLIIKMICRDEDLTKAASMARAAQEKAEKIIQRVLTKR